MSSELVNLDSLSNDLTKKMLSLVVQAPKLELKETLNPTQCNYTTTEKELLFIAFALEKIKSYILWLTSYCLL